MKKTLLLSAALFSFVSGFAQNNRQAANHANKSLAAKTGNYTFESEVQLSSQPASNPKRLGNNLSPNALCQGPTQNNGYTSGPNLFGVGGGATTYQQNCLSYNQDLNSYVFTHRRSARWAVSNTMSSGNIQSTWINITTGAKDSAILYYEATAINPARYPSGTFYNPAGNTNIANTYLVATGPSLPGNGTIWGSFHSTRKLTGTSADQTNPGVDLNYNTVNSPNGFGSGDFMNYDLQQVGTNVFVGGAATDTTTSQNGNHCTTIGGIIGKCDFSSGSPVWSYDSIIPGYYFNRNDSGNGNACEYGQGGRLAFGPNGMVGYWVSRGRLATNYGNSADSTLSPIVYKTTNGGLTWVPVLQGYDWSMEHPELSKNVGRLNNATDARHFKLNYQHGVDLTVDANNVLHLVGTMIEPYEHGKHVDSLGFSYTYNYDYINQHPIMWDLMTDGSCWKTMMIDSIASSWLGGDPAIDTTATNNPLSDGAGKFLNYGARLQVSRSTDGSKIIYSWSDSDPNSTGSLFNIAPDIFMKAYDISSNKVTATANITNGMGVCFSHMMADVAYFDANSRWVAPCMYSVPRVLTGTTYSGTAITDHFWMDCGSFGISDFTLNAPVNDQMDGLLCSFNVRSYGNATVNSISNYPNPFSNTTNITVKLNEARSIDLQISDALGNVVALKKIKGNVGENTFEFDATGLNAGVYFYTISTGYEKTTRKMIIQK